MILLATLLAASAPPPAAARPSPLDPDAAAVARAAAALEPHIEGTWLDGKLGSDALADAQWRAVQRWAADWFDLHPNASAAALVQASKRFGDSWSISAVGLGRGDILVAASRYQPGNVFILGADRRGRHRLRWSIAAPQQRLDPAADLALSQWRPAVQNDDCRSCRLMGSAVIGRLPAAVDGAGRFWIRGGYMQEMGATMGQQLSLWSWRHGRARPLLVRDFAIMADQGDPVLRGSTLYVPSKGGWRSLSSCGSCFGRVIDLRYAIGPRAVRTLARVSRTPELDLVDRVYARVLSRQPVGALAAPSALRVIRKRLHDRIDQKDPQLRIYTGMVMGWKHWRSHGESWACVDADAAGTLAFAFDRRLTRITAAHPLDDGACRGKGARM